MSRHDWSLLRVSAEGARGRRAVATLEAVAPELVAALKRALAFLVRRGTAVSVTSVAPIPAAEVMDTLPRPLHVTELVATRSGAKGKLVLDRLAIALTLDGVLGGDGSSPPELPGEDLSPTQTALISRIATAIVGAYSDAFGRAGLSRLASEPPKQDGRAEGVPVTCTIELGSGENVGRVVLLLSQDALAPSAERAVVHRDEGPAPQVLETLAEVEVELVAELGRKKLRFPEIASLAVGDLLRLDLPVTAEARVHCDGQPLFRGRPTANAGQIAIEVTQRHEP
jgi:flagellar motor switch protein FliM